MTLEMAEAVSMLKTNARVWTTPKKAKDRPGGWQTRNVHSQRDADSKYAWSIKGLRRYIRFRRGVLLARREELMADPLVRSVLLEVERVLNRA